MLASAALEIMTALSGGDASLGNNRLRAFLEAQGFPEKIKDEVFDSLSHSYNFSKHSSRDASVINDYPVDYMIMTIYSSVDTYKTMFEEFTPEMNMFYGIVIAWKIRWWEGETDQEDRRRIAERLGLSNSTRTEVQMFGRRLLEAQRAAL